MTEPTASRGKTVGPGAGPAVAAPKSKVPDAPPGKGAAFFQRADQLAETNCDYAIEMFLEGLKREPDNIARGHQGLREVSLKRKLKGGKPAGLMEQMKRRGGKTPVEKLVSAEFFLAKEPGNVGHMVAVMKAAQEAELPPVVKWVCDIILEAERQAAKPNKGILLHVLAAYEKINEYAQAIQACQLAIRAGSTDDALQAKLRDLSALNTVKQGKYDQEGDFTKGVRNMDEQTKLAQGEYFQQGRKALEARVESTRKDYLASPTVPGKIHGFVDALCKIEEESFENEAVDVLKKAFADTGAYQYKVRVGDIHMRQMTRRYRKLAEAGDKAAAIEQARKQLAFELDEYSERAVNYPTDLKIKFELGKRQLLSGRLDDAIASFQQSQRDPALHVRSLLYLGQAFAAKKWYREAAETYEKALTAEMTEERVKDVRFAYGDVREMMGDTAATGAEKIPLWQKALDEFSQVAQIDLRFKDVAARIERLRKKITDARAADNSPAH
jgi:tetratricopeptide (TPR) repeat protein